MRKKSTRMVSAVLTGSMVLSMLPVSVQPVYAASDTHIATYVGQIPEALKGDAGVTADQFSKAYDTVKVTSNDVEYTVEVVPQELVYFIDSVDVDAAKNANTEPYDAVWRLTGGTLKNDRADQLYTAEEGWGYVDADAKAKGHDGIIDKTATGIYGANNAAGETISYTMDLDAGTYELTSGHTEWWPTKKRGMRMSISYGNTVIPAGQTPDVNNNANYVNEAAFTLENPETVTYTVTATDGQAPVISWLGVAKTEEGTEPVVPTAPFNLALEETDGALVSRGAAVVEDKTGNKQVKITAGWNDNNSGHAEIADAQALFGRPSFTLLANVKIEGSDSQSPTKKAAFSIGTEEQNLHIFTQAGALGYGASTAGGGGESVNQIPLANVDASGWNALALVYEEKDGGNGSAVIYMNGQKAGEVVDLGFKLSTMNLTANLGRSFKTNFLLNGLYDNIVVKADAMTEADAVTETAKRLEAIQNSDIGKNIIVKGSDVDAAAKMTNGLTYKGWGLLSCNGTSNLLMDYKAEAPEKYWEMIDTLFGGEHPLISHVKIEMGNDGNTSTAADPATIRYDGEEADASRSPGWQLAADARSVNPDVKVSVLRWCSPNWTDGNLNTPNIYRWYRDTIFDAYEKYGVMTDYVSVGVNEKSDPVGLASEFSRRIEAEADFPEYMDAEAIDAYHNLKVISADEIDSWTIVDEMYDGKNQGGAGTAWDDVDVVGVHYTTGTDERCRDLAAVYNKEFWYSEGCANFGFTSQSERRTDTYVAMGGTQSPLAMVDGYLNAFANGNMTHYIFQPAIGAFYDGLQYAHKDLVSAREPWAGYMRYDEGLYMTAHFTRFAKSGWAKDDTNSNGIWLGIPQASYGYAGDNSKNEHLSNEAGNPSYMTLAAPDKSDFSVVAVNNSPIKKTYRIQAVDMNLGDDKTMEIWQTKAGEYMVCKGEISPDNDGYYEVTVDEGAIATFTTLDEWQAEGDRALTLPAHTDVSDKAVLDTDETGKMGAGYTEVTDDDILYADNFEYAEEAAVEVSTGDGRQQQDYLYSRGNEPRYMLDTHGAWVVEEDGSGNNRLGQILNAGVSQWNGGDPETIVGDHRWMNYKASIDVQADNGYALLGIRQQTGMNSDNSGYNLKLNGSTWELRKGGSVLQSGTLPEKNENGGYRIALEGRDNTIIAYANEQVLASYTDNSKPYLFGRVFLGSAWRAAYFDNLKVEKISGYMPYARAFYDDHDKEVQYTGNWTLAGPGDGSADNWYRTTAYNNASGEGNSVEFSGNGTGFALVGENGTGAVVDIYVDGQLAAENVEQNASNKRYSTVMLQNQEDGEHRFQVVVKSGKLTIDGVYILGKAEGSRVELAEKLPSCLAVSEGSVMEVLPQTVKVQQADGTTADKKVAWKLQGDVKAYETITAVGTIENMPELPVSIRLEIVPEKLVYFIDSYTTTPGENATTPVYEAVRALAGDTLLNQTADQISDGSVWGFSADGVHEKTNTDLYDKYSSGFYMGDGKAATYYLPLEAGSYALTMGANEWWSNQNRGMRAAAYLDGQILGTADMTLGNTVNARNHATLEITLEKAATVVFALEKTGSKDAQISWVAVADISGEIGADTASVSNAVRELNTRLESFENVESTAVVDTEAEAKALVDDWIAENCGDFLEKGFEIEAVIKNFDAMGELHQEANQVTDGSAAFVLKVTFGWASEETDEVTTEFIYSGSLEGGEIPEYDSFSGTAGGTGTSDRTLWLDSDGTHIQAHGGQVQGLNEMDVDFDLDENGEIEDKIVWLWYGEDKTRNGNPIDGVNCYVSTDLYNWENKGTVLRTHDVIPAKISDTGEFADSGVALDETALDTLKSWAELEEPNESVSQKNIDMAKNFLEAYVDDSSETGYDEESLKLAFWNLYTGYGIVERPKMLYNEETGKYIVIYHQDAPSGANIKNFLQEIIDNGSSANTGSRYTRASMGFAVSDTPFGPFKLVNVQRLNYHDGEYSQTAKLGMARDMNVFLDDTDIDQNGVPDAYVIYSSEENAKMYISLLNGEYTGPAAEGSDDTLELADGTQIPAFATRVLPDNSREAPALMKYDGYYYMITSGTSGWAPNPATYYRAEDIFGPWEAMGDPCEGGSSTTFDSQSTSIIPYNADAGQFIYMGDRWRTESGSSAKWYSSYVWLPIQITEDHKLELKKKADWDLSMMEQMTHVTVNTELPTEIAYGAADDLPDTVNVTVGGETFDAEITWELPKGLGMQTIQGTLKDWNYLVTTEANVVFDHAVYFADCGAADAADSEYFQRVAALSADTIKNPDAPDQAYTEGSWGYEETDNIKARTGGDIYERLQYQNGSSNRDIEYRFDDMKSGVYEIFVGFFDPWAQYANGKRVANVSIEANDMQIGEAVKHNISGNKDMVVFSEMAVAEGEDLRVRIAPVNTGNNTDVMVSYIAIRTKQEESEKPEIGTVTGIEITNLPNQLIYEVDEAFNPAGMTVEAIRTATSSDAERVELKEEEYEVTGFDSSEEGRVLVTVTYETPEGTSFEDSFYVTISNKEYYTAGIHIVEEPVKKKYYVDEELDETGMKVEVIKKTASSSNAVREPLDKGEYDTDYDFSKPGRAVVTVTYDGENADGETETFKDIFTVTVIQEDEFYTRKIRVAKQPNKTAYRINEEFDPEGMKVMNVQVGSPSDAVREEAIPFDELDFDYDFSTAGSKTVKVLFWGYDKNQEENLFTAKVTVQVAEEAEKGFYTEKIQVTAMPKKLRYVAGDRFNPDGMIVTAYQVNAETGEVTEETITNYQISPAVFMKAGSQIVTISYSAVDADGNAKMFTASVPVIVEAYNGGNSGSDEEESSGSSSGSSGTLDGSGSNGNRPSVNWPESTMEGGIWKKNEEEKTWQYVKENGALAKNEWGRIEESWYFFTADGDMAADQWILDDSVWYYVDASGAMQYNTWVLDNNTWYFVDSDGSMYANRWVLYKGNWYYLGANGAMEVNTITPDGYRVDAEGKWIM